MRVLLFLLVVVSCSMLLWACESGPFKATYEPGFAHTSGMRVSVFGVFKDGRMSPESWKQIGHALSAPMGSAECAIAYDDEFMVRDTEVSSAVDAYTREEGPTDALLDQFAAAATGDQIMVVTISGHPPQTLGGNDAGARPQRSQGLQAGGASGGGGRGTGGRGMGGGRRGGASGMPSGSQQHEITDGSVFEVSASLFTVRLHRTVGALSLTYSGPSAEEALAQFAEKFRTELPHAQCTAWNRDAAIDADRIRKMVER